MGFNCGIIGLPNVGKSSLFNALTRSEVQSKNYPFCTIDPNIGLVPVPDRRLKILSDYIDPLKTTPTTIEFVDIAGLVKGASKGEGLGNQFLSHIRRVDAIAHVVRCFDNPDIAHIDENIDPERDIEIIEMELLLADLQILTNAREKIEKQAKFGDKSIKERLNMLSFLVEEVGRGTKLINIDDKKVVEAMKGYNLLTLKPTMYIANVDEEGLIKENQYVSILNNAAKKENISVIKMCCKLEEELAFLEENERKEFLHEMGVEHAGLERVVTLGYKLVNLITFFTAGKKEVKAWTLKKGGCAVEAAGKIHSDIARGFIRAEITDFDIFCHYKSMNRIKEVGKIRLEGKDYIMKDGDIALFRFNV